MCLTVIDKEDDLIVISDQGMIIRTHLKEISTIGRDTQGVKIITLSEGQIVASMAIVPHNEEDDEEEIEEETIYPNLTILDDEGEKEQEVEETEDEE